MNDRNDCDRLAELGRMARTQGLDAGFVVGMDGTRWSVHAISNFPVGVHLGAKPGEYVLILLGDGAYANRAYCFRWDGVLDAGYVGSKFGMGDRERDANDLTRLLAAFLGREPQYYGGALEDLTERAYVQCDLAVLFDGETEQWFPLPEFETP